ncbi:hypothetical protein HUJ05_007552 [Dendroctonus ponderosae]|nr:hypothetical protein HUJ05_007552 [Dendroctonus ponderosae]
MIYFFHHYELPAILQQGHFQHILFRPAQQQPTNPAEPTNLHRYLQIRGRFSQFFSAVRPSATTQTSTIAVTPVATVATSTSTITSSSVRSTVTVGTNVQPSTFIVMTDVIFKFFALRNCRYRKVSLTVLNGAYFLHWCQSSEPPFSILFFSISTSKCGL